MSFLRWAVIALFSIQISCGPVAGSLISASLFGDLGSKPDTSGIADGIARGLACALSTLFGAPSISIELSESEFLEIDGAIGVYRLNANDFWTRFPEPMRKYVLAALLRSYEARGPEDTVRQQPIEFYQNLFAKGLIDIRNRGYRSNWMQLTRAVETRGRDGKLYIQAYGVFVAFTSDRFKNEKGESQRDEVLYCP